MKELAADVGGLVVIGLIVWWFWLSKPKTLHAGEGTPIDIVVADGVYTPARIEVPAGRPVTLRFLRKDPSPCAEKVVFEAFDNMTRDLPLDRPLDVTIVPDRPGEYAFTCQMKMYRGTLVVKNP
ncbi:MAG: cupredoxin domain-containing protein [Gammaproteobacteria bacterium]|nr:cupredoxin domain-containing protein [Gammaproteobacteria bacterium]